MGLRSCTALSIAEISTTIDLQNSMPSNKYLNSRIIVNSITRVRFFQCLLKLGICVPDDFENVPEMM